jgi:hypothetical protein
MLRSWLLYVVETAVVLCGVTRSADAQAPVQLHEAFPVGARYQAQIRVQLSGTLTLPAEKGKPDPKPLQLTGESSIDYEERVLSLDKDDKVNKTIRVFRRIDFERQLGTTPQKATLRPSVRRIVQVRMNNTEVPFSPDGPLTWGEIDLLRTDVFLPALAGLLPGRAVRVGERWKASVEAVKELTDYETIDEGSLDCRLDRIFTMDQRRQARVSLTGTVRGTNEDGPARQQLDGFFWFDLDGKYLASLTLNGKHTLLNGDGKEMGRVEGRFVLSRQPGGQHRDLSDDALRGLSVEPGPDTTRLLYENEDLKLSFLYPRRWRVSGVQGRQVTLDGADGNGLMLTVEPTERVPTGAQFLAESRAWLEKQKGRILRVAPPRSLQLAPQGLEQFSIEAEMDKQKIVMDYYVLKQATGGATIAARLLPNNLAVVQKEVEAIARSVRLR